MLLGHFAVGFAAKRAAPRAGLLALLGAAMFLDLVWPFFMLIGVETVRIVPGLTAVNALDFEFPWSHSLLMALVWSALFAALYLAGTRDRVAAAWTGALVFSHWVLDWITHIPDLPLWPRGPEVGLGLWNSAVATVAVEVPMFLIGLAIYLATTRSRGWVGHVSLWTFVVFAAFVYAGNIGGEPPPSSEALRYASLSLYLLIPWFWWIDRTRALRSSIAASH